MARRAAVLSIAFALLSLAPTARAAGSCECTATVRSINTATSHCWNITQSPGSAALCKTLFLPHSSGSTTIEGKTYNLGGSPGEFLKVGGQASGVAFGTSADIDANAAICRYFVSDGCGTAAGGEVVDAVRFEPIKPTVRFAPPSLSLSDVRVRNLGGGVQVVNLPWIAEYIAAFYRWSLPVASITAVLLIVIAGIRWMISGGAGEIQQAKKMIQNAVIGLTILLSTYLILRVANPALVNLPELQVRIVQPENPVEENEEDAVDGVDVGGLVVATGDNIIGNTLIDYVVLEDIRSAAQAIKSRGIQIALTSSYRSTKKQTELILRNCQNPPGSQTCSPKPGRPTTCIMRSANPTTLAPDPAACPHTTGRAVDAWGAIGGRQCFFQKACLEDLDACRRDPCQKAVIEAMRAQGFCNLASEPWHFEKPKMSSRCT